MLTSSICEGKERENKNGNLFCAHIKYTKKCMVICSYMNSQVQCLLKLCRDFSWSSILHWKKTKRFTVFSGFVFHVNWFFFRANHNFGNTLLCLYRKQISVPVLWSTFYLPVYKNLLAFMVSEALLYSSSHKKFWQQTRFLSGKKNKYPSMKLQQLNKTKNSSLVSPHDL